MYFGTFPLQVCAPEMVVFPADTLSMSAFEIRFSFAGIVITLVSNLNGWDFQALPVENMSSYGSGGERFVVGGLLFRKAWNWEIIGQNVGEVCLFTSCMYVVL